MDTNQVIEEKIIQGHKNGGLVLLGVLAGYILAVIGVVIAGGGLD